MRTLIHSTMIRRGFIYAEASRGPVPTQRGTTAGLTPIPTHGEAFPPLGPPLSSPTPAPVATASDKDPEAVHVVSLCQWHILISIYFVLAILENANTYIIVNYVRSCSRKSALSHHHHHHRGQSSIARTAGRILEAGQLEETCSVVVAPVARGPRRTTHWTPSR